MSVSACPNGTTPTRCAGVLWRRGLLSVCLLVALGAQASTDDASVSEGVTSAPVAARHSEKSAEAAGEPAAAALSPRMQAALAYVKARYKVSKEVLLPLFDTVQWIARERGLDPLLLVALIGIESGFNPQAKSAGGGHGLMQIIPRHHIDKLPEGQGIKALMDPAVNVEVGARILDEAIRRGGSTKAGLQFYNGSDRKGLFARRVLAERERLEQGHP